MKNSIVYYVFLYNKKRTNNVIINVNTPEYINALYTKSFSNCSNMDGSSSNIYWDYKLNGIRLKNITDTNATCDLNFTQISNPTLLSTQS